MRRPLRLPEPANPLDPEIRQAMVTKDIAVPPDDFFKGIIREDQIADLDKVDRKTLLAMSVQSQWLDWLISAVETVHENTRQLDAEQARRKIERAKSEPETIEQTLLWKIAKWSAAIIAAGALSALGQYLITGK